jgi:hypothetical protein
MVIAKGQLLYEGKPFKVDPKAGVTIKFIPVVEPGKPYTSFTSRPDNREEMTFQVTGPTGRGIPLGKYKIAVFLIAGDTPNADEINEQFSDQNTKVERDVQSDEPLRIDLSKPAG